jgi:PAS domain S-box-containing protein
MCEYDIPSRGNCMTFLKSGAGKVALVYLVTGLAWIFFSDNLAFGLAGGSEVFLLFSVLKGFVFIIVTTVMLYGLIRYFAGESEKQQQALLRYEARYRKLYESMTDAFATVDMTGTIKEYNPAFREMLGYSDEELHGFTFQDITPGKWHDTETRILKEQVLPHGHSEFFEKEYRRCDGTIFPVELRVFLIRDDTGQPAGMGAVIRDITERKQAELALDAARRKLNVLSTITNQDIQSAAFSLSAYLELTKKEDIDGNVQEYLDKESAIVGNITKSLNFARDFQELGMMPPRWQNVEEGFIFAISHLDFLAISRTITLDNLEVYADTLFEKALFHLMQNTLTHGTGATGVRIGYQVIEGGLRLAIEDNGTGIPPDEKERIFERGYGKGDGFGLFLVREILSVTGMSIRESGEPGNGARFEITVPSDAYRFPPRTADP